MSENRIKILKIEPGQAPQVKEIQNDLASLQAAGRGHYLRPVFCLRHYP